jgi:hypothetical protein
VQIPAVVESNRRGESAAEMIDVFFEKGVFETEDSTRILQVALFRPPSPGLVAEADDRRARRPVWSSTFTATS